MEVTTPVLTALRLPPKRCIPAHGGDVFKTSRSTRSHGLFFVLRLIFFALVSQDRSLDPHALSPLFFTYTLRRRQCFYHCPISVSNKWAKNKNLRTQCLGSGDVFKRKRRNLSDSHHRGAVAVLLERSVLERALLVAALDFTDNYFAQHTVAFSVDEHDAAALFL